MQALEKLPWTRGRAFSFIVSSIIFLNTVPRHGVTVCVASVRCRLGSPFVTTRMESKPRSGSGSRRRRELESCCNGLLSICESPDFLDPAGASGGRAGLLRRKELCWASRPMEDSAGLACMHV